MPVGVDQTGHDDETASINHLRARCREVLADIDDRSIVYVHVTVGQIGLAGLHGHDIGVTDNDISARRQVADRWRDRRLRAYPEALHGAECCNAAEKCTSTD